MMGRLCWKINIYGNINERPNPRGLIRSSCQITTIPSTPGYTIELHRPAVTTRLPVGGCRCGRVSCGRVSCGWVSANRRFLPPCRHQLPDPGDYVCNVTRIPEDYFLHVAKVWQVATQVVVTDFTACAKERTSFTTSNLCSNPTNICGYSLLVWAVKLCLCVFHCF